MQPSALRLNILRCGYLLLVVGLGLAIWPSILDPSQSFGLQRGVVVCMLASLSAFAVLGLRYPLGMLPLLFFEMGWKVIWLLRIALPLWSGHRLDAGTTETVFECLVAVVFPFVIPWSYVWTNYLVKPADPWRRIPATTVSSEYD
jgi:hypothetical protein